MTNIFAVLFQVTAALFILRAVLRGSAARQGDAGGGPVPRPRPLHALDEPVGLGLPGPAHAGRAAAAPLPAARAGPDRDRLRRHPPRASTCSATCPGCGQGHRLAELPEHTKAIWSYHAGLRADAPLLQQRGTRGRGCTGRPGTTSTRTRRRRSCAASWPSATRRCGGSRCPSTLWALVTGARARDPRRLFSGARLLLPLPALGPLAAHAQLQPLPLRGHPLRVPEPGHAPRPRLGRGGLRRVAGPRLPRRWSWCMFFFFLPFLLGAARSRPPGTTSTSGAGGPGPGSRPGCETAAAVLTAAAHLRRHLRRRRPGPRARACASTARARPWSGAAFMVAFHVVTPEQAYRMVDLGTLVLLFGMMVVVAPPAPGRLLPLGGGGGGAARALAPPAPGRAVVACRASSPRCS